MIKICGIQDVGLARFAASKGAGAIGFMLAPSRRRIAPESIASILMDLPPERPLAVGVVVNESPLAIDEIVRVSGIDIVQLSGDESPDMVEQLDHTVWKAIRFPAGTTIDEASQVLDSWLASSRPIEAVMIDAAVPGRYGGTGHTADWELVARLAETYPVILAGGLTPANVGGAIASVRPAGVDVSSGVEVDGSKDPPRIEAFIDESRAAFGRLQPG
ncbi:MAG: phosphoribosylanthranilate isomerase [Chloroflexia bacterium]|nr:phosphoribosylanthranilate isomerase [Chloroflexia bacterium]